MTQMAADLVVLAAMHELEGVLVEMVMVSWSLLANQYRVPLDTQWFPIGDRMYVRDVFLGRLDNS